MQTQLLAPRTKRLWMHIIIWHFQLCKCKCAETLIDYSIAETQQMICRGEGVYLCPEFLYNGAPTLISPLGLRSLKGLNGTELLYEVWRWDTTSCWNSTGTRGAAPSPFATQDVWLKAKLGADGFSLLCCSLILLWKYAVF